MAVFLWCESCTKTDDVAQLCVSCANNRKAIFELTAQVMRLEKEVRDVTGQQTAALEELRADQAWLMETSGRLVERGSRVLNADEQSLALVLAALLTKARAGAKTARADVDEGMEGV
jgi:hypothetical protein